MRIALTGAGGYVGRHLLARWSDDPELRVVAVGRGGALQPRNVSWHGIDWREAPSLIAWRQYLRGCDTVVHTAARVHAEGRAGQEVAAFEQANVTLTLTLARAALDVGVRHFIHLSSVAVHGEAPFAPLQPAAPLRPETPYAASKARAEVELQALCAGGAMALTVLRPPLIYGPEAPGNMARLARWVAAGRPLPLGAARHNQRSLLAVDNLVDCIEHCRLQPPATGAPPRIVLPADAGAALSTRAMIEALAAGAQVTPRLLAVPLPLLRLGLRLGGRGRMVAQLLGDRVIAPESMATLGWQPRLDSAAGLRALGATYNAR